MSEYIKREAVEKMLENASIISDGEYCGYCTEDVCIDSISTADVAPVRHGYWDDISESCSVCGSHWAKGMVENAQDWGYFDPMPEYCPYCGAKMDLEDFGV